MAGIIRLARRRKREDLGVESRCMQVRCWNGFGAQLDWISSLISEWFDRLYVDVSLSYNLWDFQNLGPQVPWSSGLVSLSRSLWDIQNVGYWMKQFRPPLFISLSCNLWDIQDLSVSWSSCIISLSQNLWDIQNPGLVSLSLGTQYHL